MTLDTVCILDGNTFVVSDRRGDLDATPIDNHGLFLEDTRFLSSWMLTVYGIRPKPLSVDEQAYYEVQFFQALTTGTVYVDSHLSVVRRRCVIVGFEETIEIENHGKEAIDPQVKLEVAADFADLFEVKDKLAKIGELYSNIDDGSLDARLPARTFVRETSSRPSQKGEIREDGLSSSAHRAAVVLVDELRRARRAVGGPTSKLERPRDRRPRRWTPAWSSAWQTLSQAAPRLVTLRGIRWAGSTGAA